MGKPSGIYALRLFCWFFLIAFVTVFKQADLQKKFYLNWADAVVDRAWFNIKYLGVQSNQLQDGIPDNWVSLNWSGARGKFSIDNQFHYSGNQSALITKINNVDASVLEQQIKFPSGGNYTCGVFHQGDGGFLAIRGDGVSGRSDAELPAVNTWQLEQIGFSITQEGVIRLIIGIRGQPGEIWLDSVFCHLVSDFSDNLVLNPDFEQDGIRQNLLEWWAAVQTQVTNRNTFLDIYQKLGYHGDDLSFQNANRLNMIDLLLGRPQNVMERMRSVSRGCGLLPESPSFLLGMETEFESMGGLAAREKLIQFAQRLMPDCPQPYAHLAALYQSVGSYTRAVYLLHEASILADPGPQLGKYAYEEGVLELTSTGEKVKAVQAFTTAIENAGWEPAPWYQGAAWIYKGQALMALDRCTEAREAFEKVLECPSCSERFIEASSYLAQLNCVN